MRLTPTQIQTITQTISQLTGGTAEVFLFGSRVDDRSRGGDVDLLIETPCSACADRMCADQDEFGITDRFTGRYCRASAA